jgi:hypothetical protein
MKQTISASKVEKYFKFLNKCHEQMTDGFFGLPAKDLYILQKQHRVSANTVKVMKDGGLIKKDNNIYNWKTSNPTTSTARELFFRLKEVNKKYNEKRSLAKKPTPVQNEENIEHIDTVEPESSYQIIDMSNSSYEEIDLRVDKVLLERQFLDSMPKIKKKRKKRVKQPKREVSILWGLITYKTY